MAPPIYKLLRLGDIGKGLVQNATTKLIDVLLSTQPGNGLSLDTSNALYCPPGQRIGDNLFRNASFAINQRALSGTVTLAAGQYGHDGLIAGNSGATYKFAASGLDTTITILSGQLVLPVAPELIDGSPLHFNFSGTVGFRIASNQTVAQLGTTNSNTAWYTSAQLPSIFTPGAGTQVNIMFGDPANANNAVTLVRPTLERFIAYLTPTAFQRRDPAVELAICQRYYWQSSSGTAGGTGVGSIVGIAFLNNSIAPYRQWTTQMRSTPIVTLYNNGVIGQVRDTLSGATYALNPNNIAGNAPSGFGFFNNSTGNGSGLTRGDTYDFDFTASAELT